MFVCFALMATAQDKLDSLFYLNGNVEVVSIVKNSSESIDCKYVGEDLLTTINKSKLHKIVFKSGRVEVCNKLEEKKVDKIFFKNGEVAEGKVVKITEDAVEYTLPNEDLIISTYKAMLHKIVFSGGRVEEFQNLLNIKIITSDKQWRDVVITYNVEDTRGLERVGTISEASGWGGALASGKGYNNAVEKLQKEAADMGCGLVLVNMSPTEHTSSHGSGVRVNATAYRIPVSKNKPSEDDIKEEANTIALFYNGEINKLNLDEQEKKVDVFEAKIRKGFSDAVNKEEYDAVMKEYNDLCAFLNKYEKQPRWAKRALGRMEDDRKEAEKRVNLKR